MIERTGFFINPHVYEGARSVFMTAGSYGKILAQRIPNAIIMQATCRQLTDCLLWTSRRTQRLEGNLWNKLEPNSTYNLNGCQDNSRTMKCHIAFQDVHADMNEHIAFLAISMRFSPKSPRSCLCQREPGINRGQP